MKVMNLIKTVGTISASLTFTGALIHLTRGFIINSIDSIKEKSGGELPEFPGNYYVTDYIGTGITENIEILSKEEVDKIDISTLLIEGQPCLNMETIDELNYTELKRFPKNVKNAAANTSYGFYYKNYFIGKYWVSMLVNKEGSTKEKVFLRVMKSNGEFFEYVTDEIKREVISILYHMKQVEIKYMKNRLTAATNK